MNMHDVLPPLTWQQALLAWRFSPVVTALALAAAAGYLAGVIRLNRRHPSRRWPWPRAASFLAGVAVVVVAVEGSPEVYGHVLFWVHMVQHLMLIMVAPWLLCLGLPLTLLLRTVRGRARRRIVRAVRSRVGAFATFPLVTLSFYVLVIVGIHLTSFMQAMMEHPVLGSVEQVLYLVSGYLLFSQVLSAEPSRWDMSYPLRMFQLFLAMSADTVVGVILLQATHPWFAAYAAMPRMWGPSPVADLRDGGAVMWMGGDGLMFLMMLVVAAQWLTDSRPEASRAGRWLESARRSALATTGHEAAETGGVPAGGEIFAAPDVDNDDAALAAYNAMLARLNRAGTDHGHPQEHRP